MRAEFPSALPKDPVDYRRPIINLSEPMNVRSTSLAVLAVLGTIYFLRVAQAVFIPITIAIATACAIAPIVRWLQRRARIPKPLGAAAVLLALCALLGAGVSSLQPQAMHILDVVPKATAKFSDAMRQNARNHDGALQKLNRAATEIERAAAMAKTPSAPRAVSRPSTVAPESSINIRDYIMMGTADAVAGFGQLVVVLALVFFLLISGDSFRLALIRASGPSIRKKKMSLRMFSEIVAQVQRYLGLQVATSALVGLVIGVAFVFLGLDNAMFWACCGAVLHMIPYVGPAVFLAMVSMVAYVQFQTWPPVVGVILSILISTGVIGMLLVPWLTQKVSRLHAITVFISLLFWGWLWGAWGLLLGIPIMMALNVVFERIEGLNRISHFLSGGPTRLPRATGDDRALATEEGPKVALRG